MKTKSLYLCLCLVSLICATGASASQEVIFADTFEDAITGSLNGQSTSDGKATYSVVTSSSNFVRANRWSTAPSYIGQYLGQSFNNPNGSTWITVSTDFNAYDHYMFQIGYLSLTGTGSFAIAADSTSNTLVSAFVFTASNSSSIKVSYVNENGIATDLGTITATQSDRNPNDYYLVDVGVIVSNDSQQLVVGGVTYGSFIGTTQGSFAGEGVEKKLRLNAAGGLGALDVRIDNLSAVVIPEPSSMTAIFAITSFSAVVLFRRLRRSIRV